MMMCITAKREQEELTGGLLRFKSWHVAPHSPFSKHSHSHTQGDTHRHTGTWLISSPFTANTFLGTEWRHTGQSSQGFPWMSSYTHTYTETHTEMLSFQERVGFSPNLIFFLYSGAYSKKYRFQFKEKVKHSKTVFFWANRKCCVVPQGQHFVRISRCLIRRKVFFFLKFRLFRWSLRVTETKTLQEAFKKKQLLEFSCVNLNPFVLIQRPVICSSEQWKQPSTGTTNWPCLNLWTNQRCGWQLRCLEPEPARLQRVLLQTHFPLLSVRLLWSPTPLLSSIMITLIPGNHCVKQQTHVDSDVDGSTKGWHFAFWSREVI